MFKPTLLAPLFLSACAGTNYTYSGYKPHQFFPLDGTRAWDYAQEDEAVLWRLHVEKVEPVENKGATEIVTLEYSEDEGDLLYSVRWSSDSADGIQVHGYTDEASGTTVDYDQPVAISSSTMAPGDAVTTQTNGTTFTSSLETFEACENTWRADWDCLKFVIDDGDGDDMSGPPFAGTWWLATSYGASRFIPTGYTSPWVLASATWQEEED